MIDWKQDGSLMLGNETSTMTDIGKAIKENEEAKPERDYLLDDPELKKKKDEVKQEMKTIFNNYIDKL